MTDPHSIADRQVARVKAKINNREIDYGMGAEAARRFAKYQSTDPFPGIPPALLNSADIADYVSATGMLEPFYPDSLKTASYEIRLLGRWFYLDGTGQRHEGDLREGEEFTLPHNSIAFMTVEPYFRIPDYIALRHNLKIDHIYKGLLVGTGPLIDPGFTGKIALPLHNLTMNDYKLVGGQGIIWVEFTKLSPSSSWGQDPSVPQQAAYANFPAEKTATKVVDDYVKDAVGLDNVPASSSARIAQVAEDAETTAIRSESRLGRLSLWGTIGILALTISIVSLIVVLTGRFIELEAKVQELSESVGTQSQLPPLVSSTPSPDSEVSSGPTSPMP